MGSNPSSGCVVDQKRVPQQFDDARMVNDVFLVSIVPQQPRPAKLARHQDHPTIHNLKTK
jgi:hypothetical protein